MSPEARERAFDALATEMASGSISRGKALRLMGAALVGGTLASLGIGGVAGADNLCKPRDKKCRKPEQCCSHNCSGGTCAPCLPANVCSSDAECCGGTCSQISSGGFICVGPNAAVCTCEAGINHSCHALDCSDTDAMVQYCTYRCRLFGGTPYVSHTCTPNGCTF